MRYALKDISNRVDILESELYEIQTDLENARRVKQRLQEQRDELRRQRDLYRAMAGLPQRRKDKKKPVPDKPN
jgi:chromosome segregation ATPase